MRTRLLADYFFNRTDIIAAFMPWDRPHPILAGDNLDALLRAHVEGDKAPRAPAKYYNRKGGTKAESGWYRLGSYTPDADGKTRWLCLDFDGGAGHSEALADPQAAVLEAWENARRLGLPSYIERSGGGHGWHLWMFFATPIPASDARRLGVAIAPANAPLANGGEASARSNRGIEVFPKLDRHRGKKALGNLLWLPFWHAAPEGANQFYRVEGSALRIYLPESFETVTAEAVEKLLPDIPPAPCPPSPPSGRKRTDRQKSDRPRARADDDAVEEYLCRVDKDERSDRPQLTAWREWREQALARLPLEEIYGDLLTGETSGEHWLQCRNPDSPSGENSRSGSVATGDGEAPRGTFHSWLTEESMSVFDFMVRRGIAADFKDALRKVAELSGVPLPEAPPPRPPDPPKTRGGYPVIVVNNRQLRDIVWDSWQVLLAANVGKPSLFRRSGRPVRIVMVGDSPQLEFVDDTVMYGRRFFRPSLLGKVVAVDDDNYRVDVVVGGNDEMDEPGLALPKVPVASLFAQDGYGIWALPEIGAEVTVSFHDGDVTQPYVESPIFFRNQAPAGFTTGTIAIRGKQGQKVELKPGSNEIVLSAGSVKLITLEKRQEKIVGDEVRTVVGNQDVEVAGHQQTSAASLGLAVEGEARIEAGSLVEETRGDLRQKVGGGLKQSVSGGISQQVAGGVTVAVTFSKKEVVGGAYQILVAATPGIAPPPPNPAYSVLVNLGNLALDSMGGQIDIGANVLTPPLFINIGSAASGPVQLGGLGATGQPAPCGLPLQIILNTLLAVLKTVPLGIGNLGAPIAPNPAVAAALAPADSAMATLLSGKVFISQA